MSGGNNGFVGLAVRTGRVDQLCEGTPFIGAVRGHAGPRVSSVRNSQARERLKLRQCNTRADLKPDISTTYLREAVPRLVEVPVVNRTGLDTELKVRVSDKSSPLMDARREDVACHELKPATAIASEKT
jgi:hypothetical protein